MRHAESYIFQVGRFLPTLLLCLFLLTAVSASAGVVVGLPADVGSGNCFPFGCSYNAEYQQVYNSGQFLGTITITDLEFFNTQSDGGATSMNSGTWTIDLSTTAADWNTISTTYASNIGTDNTQVFSGDLAQAWAFGDTLEIVLTTPFTYDPSQGNLLLDVVGSGITAPGGGIYFDVNSTDSAFSRVFCSSGVACSDGNVNTGYGLVTGFGGGTSGVPEPSTEALFGLGVAALGLVRRRLSR
jgi:hypothetical protein